MLQNVMLERIIWYPIMFKLLLIILLVLVDHTMAYDATIKDQYGKTVGYINKGNSNETSIRDEYGVVTGYISSDGEIKDKYGSITGHIEED